MVVKDCDFTVQKGEIIGLMGESGSGKSTLAKLLLGLEKPSQGEILLDGQPYSVKKSGVRILLVFQDSLHSVNPHFTVEQVLTEALPKDVAREEIEAILEDVGLDKSFLSQPARQLSGGQLQRICIARGLLLKPDILINQVLIYHTPSDTGDDIGQGTAFDHIQHLTLNGYRALVYQRSIHRLANCIAKTGQGKLVLAAVEASNFRLFGQILLWDIDCELLVLGNLCNGISLGTHGNNHHTAQGIDRA